MLATLLEPLDGALHRLREGQAARLVSACLVAVTGLRDRVDTRLPAVRDNPLEAALMRSTAVFTGVVLAAALLWPRSQYVWLVVVLTIVAVWAFAGWRMGT